MKLVIFDIDGTLTQTSDVDSMCFRQTMAELHGIEDVSPHWMNCPHISDSGITQHFFQQTFGRDPHDHEEHSIKARLVELLADYRQRDLSFFAEIPGAKAMLDRLRRRHDWSKAIATGCWQPSAELKLHAAGIPYEGVPAGFAEDGVPRDVIVKAAITRSHSQYQHERFAHIVSVGDGVWDVRTAIQLGVAFVGIAEGARAEALRAAGAQHIIPNFNHPDHFFDLLEKAGVPIQPE